MAPTKDEIKLWLDKTGRSREWLGAQCGGKSIHTVNNWLSTSVSVPSGALTIISRLMEDDAKLAASTRDKAPSQNLVLSISEEQFRRWEMAARAKNMSVIDYSIQALEQAAQSELESGQKDLDVAAQKKISGLSKIAASRKK